LYSSSKITTRKDDEAKQGFIMISEFISKYGLKSKTTIFGFGIIAILTLMGVIGIISFLQINNETSFLRENNIKKLQSASNMKLSVVQVQQWLTDISATRGYEGFDDGFSEAEDWANKFRAESKLFRSFIQDEPEIITLQNNIDNTFEAYYLMGKEMANVYIESGPIKGNQFMEKFDPLAAKITELLDNQGKYVTTKVEAKFMEISELVSFATQVQIGVTVGGVILGIIFLQLLTSSIVNSFKTLVKSLFLLRESFNQSSSDLSSSGKKLHKGVVTQSSAVQETVATLDQISAMVERNPELAESSCKVSQERQKDINTGKSALEELITSVNEIGVNNATFIEKTEQGFQEMAKVTDFMNQIYEKTKVINDIVFQTKLLSFNASVEAARAGEHGKGFAVVAEEIGKLAELSGNSSTEISTLLDDSISEVKRIIDKNKLELGEMGKLSLTKVQEGESLANEGSQALEKILEGSDKVNGLIQDITHSSREQSEGVNNMLEAVRQIGNLTEGTKDIASDTVNSSNIVNKNTLELRDSLEILMNILGKTIIKAVEEELGRSIAREGSNIADLSTYSNQNKAA
jgi:methyl-accepting chemotaxis protein